MLLSRRSVIAGLLASLQAGRVWSAEERPSVGAIRWDAWYEKSGESVFPQNNLAPPDYQDRAPAHCTIQAGNVSCTGSQAIMDAEIRLAHAAGLSFWAFDWYAGSSSLRVGWSLYQASAINRLIDWCPILDIGSLGSPSRSTAETDRNIDLFVGYMTSKTYFHLTIDNRERPLLFLFYSHEEVTKYFNDLEGLRTAFDRMRDRAAKSSVGDPYIVLFDPALDIDVFRRSGADAISNYIGDFTPTIRGPYSDLDRQVRRYWDRMAASGAPMMPIAQVGWDTRPRNAHPVPWDRGPAIAMDDYYALATPAEFERHIRAAMDFVNTHPRACPARAVLLYSWDECDEGGCIMATRGDPQGRYIGALRSALASYGKN